MHPRNVRKSFCGLFAGSLLTAGLLLLLWAGQTLAGVEGEKKELGAIGHATYYAKRFAGRPTASGEIYDHEKLTAAHTNLPFGTRVRVVNLSNGLEVTVTVNDRCRPRKVPFIDLSRAAARAIDLLKKGTARVRIIPLPAKEAVSEPSVVSANSSENN